MTFAVLSSIYLSRLGGSSIKKSYEWVDRIFLCKANNLLTVEGVTLLD